MKTYKLNNKEYRVSWCDLCGVPVLCCDKCTATTCNCAGCDHCLPDFGDKEKIMKFEKEFLNEVKDFVTLMELFPIPENDVKTADPALEGIFGKYNRNSHIEKRKTHWNFFKEFIIQRT